MLPSRVKGTVLLTQVQFPDRLPVHPDQLRDLQADLYLRQLKIYFFVRFPAAQYDKPGFYSVFWHALAVFYHPNQQLKLF